MKNLYHKNHSFNFGTIKPDNLLKKLISSDISKISQNSDVRTKIIKQHMQLFIDFIHSALNWCIQSGNLPSYSNSRM